MKVSEYQIRASLRREAAVWPLRSKISKSKKKSWEF